MSKELDKFNKSYAPLKKKADATDNEYGAHCTNREHHKNMLLESAKEIGRVVQGLKNAGATGSKLADFANASEMKSVMKTAFDSLGALGKEDVRLKKIMKDAADTKAAIQKFEAEIDKEIAARKKKKDRKIAAKDSKSLPDMEKLRAAAKERRVLLESGVIQMQNTEKWSLATEKSNFDKWCTTEIGKTKTDRKARDTQETDGQAFDMRNVKKHQNMVKKIVSEVQGCCGKAEKHFKNRELTEADGELDKAWKFHAQLKKIQEPYTRKLASMNRYDKMAMDQSKDGKAVLAFVDLTEKAVDGLSKLIKKISRATV